MKGRKKINAERTDKRGTTMLQKRERRTVDFADRVVGRHNITVPGKHLKESTL